MKDFILQHRRILSFILTGSGLYVLWFLVLTLVIQPYGLIDIWLTTTTTEVSGFVLGLMGYDYAMSIFEESCLIYLNGYSILLVAHPCNGLELHALFAIFIISFPSDYKAKLWYIPLGMVSIAMVNVIRVVALTLIAYYWPNYLDFNHTYTFTIIVYMFIFFLWLIWIKRLESKK